MGVPGAKARSLQGDFMNVGGKPGGSAKMDKWDRRFMTLAHHLAGWSIESGRRVGAVVVSPERIVLSTGFNGLPRGVDDTVEERHDPVSGAKYLWSCHAEQNAIYNAAQIGVSLRGSTIYVPWHPCIECAKAIIQAGVSEVVGYEPDYEEPRWGSAFRLAGEMFEESGVRLRFMERLAELPRGEWPLNPKDLSDN